MQFQFDVAQSYAAPAIELFERDTRSAAWKWASRGSRHGAHHQCGGRASGSEDVSVYSATMCLCPEKVCLISIGFTAILHLPNSSRNGPLFCPLCDFARFSFIHQSTWIMSELGVVFLVDICFFPKYSIGY